MRWWIYKPDETTLTGWNQKLQTLDPERLDLNFAESPSFASAAVEGTTYTWKCQAFDGDLWGEVSSTQRFTYARAPTVTAIYPSVGQKINTVYPVSPNYGNALTAMQLTGTSPTKSAVVVDDIAATGETGKAWLLDKNNDGTLIYGPDVEVPSVPGDRWVVGAATKKITDNVIDYNLRLVAYDVNDNVLSLIGTQVNSNFIRPFWDYDAGITNSDMPANTHHVKLQLVLSDAAQEGEVRVDAWMLQKIADTGISAANFQADYSRWYGPFSGDTGTYGGEKFEEDFRWTGVPGESTSVGLPILTMHSGKMLMGYTHPNGTAIYDKRVVVQKWYAAGYHAGLRLREPRPRIASRLHLQLPGAEFYRMKPGTGFSFLQRITL